MNNTYVWETNLVRFVSTVVYLSIGTEFRSVSEDRFETYKVLDILETVLNGRFLDDSNRENNPICSMSLNRPSITRGLQHHRKRNN